MNLFDFLYAVESMAFCGPKDNILFVAKDSEGNFQSYSRVSSLSLDKETAGKTIIIELEK